jgi:Tol biopolymer transport system component
MSRRALLLLTTMALTLAVASGMATADTGNGLIYYNKGSGIYSVDPAISSSQPTVVYEGGSFDISRDRQTLVYTKPCALCGQTPLYIVPLPQRPYSGGSGTEVEISNLWDCYPTCSDVNGQNTQSMKFPKFSPDGRTIYFVGRYILPSEDDRWGIYSVPTAGGDATKIPIELVNSDGTPWLNADGTPRRDISNNKFALSPDGSKFAFGGGSSGEYGIFTVPVSGGVPTRVTDDGCWGGSAPSFSPDGRTIVYSGGIYSGGDCTGTRHQTIYTTPTNNDGTRPGTPLFPEDATDEYLPSQLVKDYPSYSPDGKYIAFTHLRNKVDTGRRLATAPATGGSITTFDYCFVCYPLWVEKPLDTTITSIISRPSGASTTTSVAFSSNDDEATFECKLDNGSFEVCASPKEYPGLAEGSSHTVEVRAVNAAGVADPTPATRAWTVNTTAPTVVGVFPADGATGVALNTNVEATFSEEMEAATVFGNFTLTKRGSSEPVAWSSMGYSGEAKKAYLDPASNLEVNTTYTATIKGGNTGAKDIMGNPLMQDHIWTFSTVAPAPTCTKTGTANAETISGTSGDDVICAGGGNDTIKGLGGNDTLKGEAGNDTLLGSVGNDALDGGLGTDTASYSASLTAVIASLATNSSTGEGSDTFSGVENLLGSPKADTLTGSAANNTLTGGGGNDTERGGAGNDKVLGSGGADSLYGEDGADAVNSKDGVNGNDTLEGGAGTDTKVTDTREASIVGFP